MRPMGDKLARTFMVIQRNAMRRYGMAGDPIFPPEVEAA